MPTTERRPPIQHSIEILAGRLHQIRYRHPDTEWCVGVAELQTAGSDATEIVTVVGALGDLSFHQPLLFYGYWDTHPRYGRQFHVQAAQAADPVTASGLVRYLSTAHCPHLGEKTAAKLVAAFGTDTLSMLREHPERLTALKGVSEHKARLWQQFFRDHQGADDVIIWLLQWDIDPSVARRLTAQYGPRAMARVRANPYALTQDTWGVGFHTADRMALSLGWAPLSPERLEAVWRFGLETALTQGDCFQTSDQLQDRAVDLLHDQDPETVRTALGALQSRLAALPDVVQDAEGRWLLAWVDRMERRLARDIRRHPDGPGGVSGVDWAWLESQTHMTYASAQRAALAGAVQSAFSIITGGPGTGKTTILHGLLTWLTQHEGVPSDQIVLAAPTARAAQRMTAVTGHPALTLHRLLGWSPTDMAFLKNAEDPLDVAWLIVDEVSMMDLPLASALWQALAAHTRVVWIGDAHQLPSVGPGSVLKDLIDSQLVPVYALTHNFRSNSGITVAAHDLLAHRVPPANADVMIARYEKGADKTGVQRDLLARIQALHQAGRPWHDIQVLTPIRRGPLGTDALNPLLRDMMNPAGPHDPIWTAQGGLSFRVGDRVMQIKNAYAHNVFNGDMGQVVAIRGDGPDDDNGARLWVQFADHVVAFSPTEGRDLRLAYATTVHKSQGSEYPVVVCSLFYDAYVMLYRNLVYTAMTRAREELWLFTEASVLWLALKRGDGGNRQTRLPEALRAPPC